MPLAVEIRLPRTHSPVFPAVCCACLAERPGDELRVVGRFSSWWELLFPWLWFVRKPVRLRAPACPDCRAAALWQRRGRFLVLVAMVAIALFVVDPWVRDAELTRQWKKLARLGAVAVLLVPVIGWWTVRPPVFDVTVAKDHVAYEFRHAEYARRFQAMNVPGTEAAR